MDFLDPKKQRAHVVRLITGYVLVGIAILLAARLLLYIATGFGLEHGKIVQNGLVFVSSHPGGSNIFLNNDKKATGKTNTRLSLPAATYVMNIQRTGYRTWQRAITVDGDSVERFDYPFLFPTNLVTKTQSSLDKSPLQASQSPSRRWLLLETSVTGNFKLLDLNNSKKIVTTTINLPANQITAPTTSAPQALKVVEWSNDNRHVLLEHIYDKTYEYIMFDTQQPSKSVNLNLTLDISPPVQLSLQNKQYDHYFVLNPATKALGFETLSNTTNTPLLKNVLAFKSYGTNVLLYATSDTAPAGQTAIMLYQNNHSYIVRNVTKSSSGTYLLDLTQFSGSWYIVAGSPNENRVYVYQNPLDVLAAPVKSALVPVTVLKLQSPTYVSFSSSAQFIVAEHANSFAVYDVQYNQNYTYKIDATLDKPQAHAAWMDGDRLDYISGGKLVVFDYDATNKQTLMPANPNYDAFFNPGYSFVYSLVASPKTATAAASTQLSSTALLTPADQ